MLLRKALPLQDELGITLKHNEQTNQVLNSNLCCLSVEIVQMTAVDDQQDKTHRPKREKKHEKEEALHRQKEMMAAQQETLGNKHPSTLTKYIFRPPSF